MTAQTPESLIYQGASLQLCSEPLAHFPSLMLPTWVYVMPNTALARCYIGTWEIESDRLYLKKLRFWKQENDVVTERGIEDLFPGHPDGVFAHWFNGILRCPRGALLKYVHGGFASIYEEDVFLRVQRGVLIEERIVRNGTAPPNAEAGYRINAMTSFMNEV
jgi:hypothetical protein